MNREWIEVPLRITDKIGDFFLWAGVRVLLIAPAFMIYGWVQLSRLSLHLAQLSQASYAKLLIVFDSLPYGGLSGTKLIEVEAKTIASSFEVETDLLKVIEGKHVLLIGGTGDGKTTTAMFIAYSVGGTIHIYDADAAANEWKGLPVVGRGADFKAIDRAMLKDLEELQERTILRAEQGSHACDGMDTVTIAEEFPLLVDEVPVASEWLIKHGKRGRRVRKFIMAIAQNDTVKNFGIEGDSGVIDCFRMIRLGKKAQAYARKLKNPALEEWLKGDRSRILVDDIPVQLPPYSEIQRIIKQGSFTSNLLPPTLQITSDSLPNHFRITSENFLKITPGSTVESGFQPPEGLQKENFLSPESPENDDFSGGEGDFEAVWQKHFWATWQAIKTGKTNYWIGKHIFGVTGGSSYQQLSQRLDEVRGINEGKEAI